MVGAGSLLVLLGIAALGFGIGVLLGGREEENKKESHAERMEELARKAMERGDVYMARLFYRAAARGYLAKARELAEKRDTIGCSYYISMAARNARMGGLEEMESDLQRLERVARLMSGLEEDPVPGREPGIPGGQ